MQGNTHALCREFCQIMCWSFWYWYFSVKSVHISSLLSEKKSSILDHICLDNKSFPRLQITVNSSLSCKLLFLQKCSVNLLYNQHLHNLFPRIGWFNTVSVSLNPTTRVYTHLQGTSHFTHTSLHHVLQLLRLTFFCKVCSHIFIVKWENIFFSWMHLSG